MMDDRHSAKQALITWRRRWIAGSGGGEHRAGKRASDRQNWDGRGGLGRSWGSGLIAGGHN